MFCRRTMLSASASAISSLVSGSAWSRAEEMSVSSSAKAKPITTLIVGRMQWFHFSYVPNPALGTPMALLPGIITPYNSVWVRAHYADSPSRANNEWSLQVDGITSLTSTLEQLKAQFKPIDIDIMCCSGLQLRFKCHLKGFWLKDILAAAGIPDSVRESSSGQVRTDDDFGIESVFWLDTADDESPFLAYEMNGASLWSHQTSPVHLFMPILPGLFEI
ncbi:MAG: molybdopterin-dependent oxidoreductase [Enhydrobacter sp.]